LDRASFNGQIYLHPVTRELVLNWIEAPERVRYTELAATATRGAHSIKPAYRFANLVKRPAMPRIARQRGAKSSRVSVADQMVDVAYNQPFQIEGPNGSNVDVTAIDANHCPGSCMYLIEGLVQGTRRAVLVSGDIRIDVDYLEALRRNPILAPYIAYSPSASSLISKSGYDEAGSSRSMIGEGADGERPRKRKRHSPTAAAAAATTARPVSIKTLDRIYLDTSQVQLDERLVSKERAVADLVSLIELYPPETVFFLNAWTPGYEDMLKAVFRAFGEQIHFDWYKARQYTCPAMRVTDPLLASLGHCDPHPALAGDRTNSSSASLSSSSSSASVSELKPFVGRFHACERRWKCDQVWQGGVGCYEWDEEYLDQIGKGVKKLVRPTTEDEAGPLVVNVNPAEMPQWCWDEYRPEKEREIRAWVDRQRRREYAVGPLRGLEDGASGGGGGGGGASSVAVPTSLVVPLARHSSRPELQDFVALFRPRTVYPLTCTNPELFKLLPVIFDEHRLAPGGVELQRAEVARHTAEWYHKAGIRKRLSAFLNSGAFAAAYGFPAGVNDDDDDDADRAGEEEATGLRMSKTMEQALAKGLNVEGDDRIVEEHLRWLQKSSERHRSAPVALGSASKSGPADVIVLSDSEDEDERGRYTRARLDGADAARTVQPQPRLSSPKQRACPSGTGTVSTVDGSCLAGPRELEFLSHSSEASRHVPQLGTAVHSFAHRPYCNRLPSPFLATAGAALDDEDASWQLTGADENVDVLRSPIRLGDNLEKSSSRAAGLNHALTASRSTWTTVDSDAVPPTRRRERPVTPSPELGLPLPPSRQPTSRPRPASVSLSDSTDLVNVSAAHAGHATTPLPGRPTTVSPSCARPVKKTLDKQKEEGNQTTSSPPVFPDPSLSEIAARDLAAFYRRYRGKIGPGGKFVYFNVGDPRLQGRSSIKAAMAAKAVAAAQARPQPKEHDVISPKSFRTVSASISISPRV
ncbi:hypothetical protein JCM3774_000475, partial [Rhodotorula dairenensis]